MWRIIFDYHIFIRLRIRYGFYFLYRYGLDELKDNQLDEMN